MKKLLTNSSASKEAVSLYNFIQENYGQKIISGVQECPGNRHHEHEMEYLLNTVGKLPAIRGLDFIHDDFDGVAARAKEWARRGGIVTICWHTGVLGNTYPASKEELPDFDELLSDGSELNRLLIGRWERAASALNELQAANIPVIWRPFHEFDGQWFWWGKGGADVFIKLWRTMYQKFTLEYRLDNLIWILGYAGEVKSGWYPGDEFCDVVGSDNYDATTNSAAFKKLQKLTDKPLAFHEVGELRPIDDFAADGCLWSWFMNWHTSYLTESNSPERLKEVYSDPRVITLDDLVK